MWTEVAGPTPSRFPRSGLVLTSSMLQKPYRSRLLETPLVRNRLPSEGATESRFMQLPILLSCLSNNLQTASSLQVLRLDGNEFASRPHARAIATILAGPTLRKLDGEGKAPSISKLPLPFFSSFRLPFYLFKFKVTLSSSEDNPPHFYIPSLAFGCQPKTSKPCI